MLATEKNKCDRAFLNHQWLCAVCQHCSGIFEKAADKGKTVASKNFTLSKYGPRSQASNSIYKYAKAVEGWFCDK